VQTKRKFLEKKVRNEKGRVVGKVRSFVHRNEGTTCMERRKFSRKRRPSSGNLCARNSKEKNRAPTKESHSSR